MTDKTWDVEDARDLPYRFSWNPDTKEVIIISMGRVIGFFENRESFNRFLLEGNKIMRLIADPIPGAVKDITGG